jgi:hypothetical protein
MRLQFPIILILMISFVFALPLKDEKSKNSKIAFYWSLAPGLGQAYNGKWLKSISIVGLELAAYAAWIENKNYYNDWGKNDNPDKLPKHRYLQKRNKYAWWIGFIYVYGMIDAVVDAHLNNFDHLMASPLESGKEKEN